MQFNFRNIFCCPTDWSREDGGVEANGGGESPDGGEGEREGGGAAHAAQLDARGVPEGRREAKQRQLVGRHCEWTKWGRNRNQCFLSEISMLNPNMNPTSKHHHRHRCQCCCQRTLWGDHHGREAVCVMSLLFMQKMRIIETYATKVYDTVCTVLIFVSKDS